jgi:inosine/xanthosine triphosphatase
MPSSPPEYVRVTRFETEPSILVRRAIERLHADSIPKIAFKSRMKNVPDSLPEQRIVVASKNPVKVHAALEGFRKSFPRQPFVALGIIVDSGVGNQPQSDNETRRGATHRATAARAHHPGADYWVGIEGGIDTVDGQMATFAWVVILSSNQTGQSRSGTFFLPPQVQALIRQGHELGDANDAVFAKHNSKQQGGAIGLLTGDIIGRQALYEHAVVLALVPFISSDLFPSGAAPGAAS